MTANPFRKANPSPKNFERQMPRHFGSLIMTGKTIGSRFESAMAYANSCDWANELHFLFEPGSGLTFLIG